MSTVAEARPVAASFEIAVTLHAIEPATFERCALIRDWLADHDIARVTLLVVPATDLHPLGDRSTELVDWLLERREAGDAIAQCGFTGSCAAHGARRSGRGEFAGLDAGETRRAVEAGWRVMRLAGVEPAGFVAPSYSYTRSLHDVLPRRFGWWMGARRMYGPRAPAGAPLSPVISPRGWTAASGLPAPLRRRAALRDPLLRVDLHPQELRPRHVRGLEELLGGAANRQAVTAAELAARAAERNRPQRGTPRLSRAS